MPILYDLQGKPVEIPEEQVPAALASGKFGFSTPEVKMVDPESGRVLTGPAGEVSEMYRRGYRLESEEEKRLRERKETYGGLKGEAITFGHGMAKAATFGMVDVAGKAIGGKAYTEDIKQYDAENPWSGPAGEMTTIIGSLALPGGQAKALQGLGKLSAPIKSVAKLGRAAERGTLKLMGGPGQGLARRALTKGTSMATGAGIEGGIYGAGEFISETALGNEELTAENLMSHVKSGILWGGAAGGGLGASGEVIGKVLGTGKAFAKRSAKSITKLYERARGVKAAEGLEEALEKSIGKPLKPGMVDKISGAYYGFDPKKMTRLKDPAALERAIKGAELREIATKRLGDLKDEIVRLHDDITKKGIGIEKFKGIRSVIDEADAIRSIDGSRTILDTARRDMDGWIMRGEAEFADPGAIKAMKGAIESADDTIRAAIKSDRPDAVAQAFMKMDSTKRTLQKRIARLWRKADKSDANWATIDGLEATEKSIREYLENPQVWGASAANKQVKANRAWVRKLKKKHKEIEFSELYETEEEGFAPIFKTNRKKLKRTIDKAGLEVNKFDEEFINRFVDDQLEPARAIAEVYDLDPKYIKKVQRMDDLGREFKAEWDKIKETVSLENQLAEITQKSNTMQSMMPWGVGAGMGYMLGGEEGAAIGLALSPFTNPGRYMQLRAALHRLSGETSAQIGKAIKSYIKKATGKIKPEKAKGIIAPTSVKVLQKSNWGDTKTKDKDRYQAFERRSKELTEFVSNPVMAAERVKSKTSTVGEVAPKVAEQMQAKAMQAAKFLYDKMPKPKSKPTLIAGKFKPHEVDLVRWERYVLAAQTGIKALLDEMQAGMPTRETVDAIKKIYPVQYAQVVTTIAGKIPELQKLLPYKEQINLSVLFGVPVHYTMEPSFVATMKMISMQPGPGEMPPPGEKPKKKPRQRKNIYKKMDFAKTALTDDQRVAAKTVA
jgi:hypothetical protein